MFKLARHLFKKSEVLLFKALRFDSPTYDYKVSLTGNERSIHLIMIESYFNEQPGFIRVTVTTSYLFIKKAIKYVLRRIIGALR